MKKLLFLFFALLVFGCVEEFDLNLKNTNSRLVVEGLVSNKTGPYYVRLTKSKTGGFTSSDYASSDNSEPIMNATVIISDGYQCDTLVPIDININEYTYHPDLGYYKLIYNELGIITDTLFLLDPPGYRHDRGFYKTNHLIGTPNRNYFLKVISEGKEYTASAYMPPVTTIDSVGYQKKISEKDGQEYYVPLLYFSEPQDTINYYLIQLIDEATSQSMTAYSLWQFSILSDKFLTPYVNGLNVDIGVSPDGSNYPFYSVGSEIHITMSSLTQEAYNFYKALLNQFIFDGGAYKPAPSSPPTNISNGGLGFFRASAIVEKKRVILISNSL